MKIRDLLKIKGRPVITIGPNEIVATAIQKLVEYDRGQSRSVMSRASWWGLLLKET